MVLLSHACCAHSIVWLGCSMPLSFGSRGCGGCRSQLGQLLKLIQLTDQYSQSWHLMELEPQILTTACKPRVGEQEEKETCTPLNIPGTPLTPAA